jgi:predicted house-cleaning noncanonical NTP pyrophosphatase (MazG superfamily)
MVMKKFKVSKLMRDKTPQWMDKKEIKYSMTEAVPESMLSHLYLKLDEEVEELLFFCKNKQLSKSQAEHNIIDEMADVLEVMESIAKEKEIRWEDVQSWKAKKIEEQGSFKKGMHIDWIQMSEDNPMLKHYEQNHRHPEIGICEHHTCGNHHKHHETNEYDDHRKEMHGERHYDHDYDHDF